MPLSKLAIRLSEIETNLFSWNIFQTCVQSILLVDDFIATLLAFTLRLRIRPSWKEREREGENLWLRQGILVAPYHTDRTLSAESQWLTHRLILSLQEFHFLLYIYLTPLVFVSQLWILDFKSYQTLKSSCCVFRIFFLIYSTTKILKFCREPLPRILLY